MEACKNLMLFTEKMFCLQTMKDGRDGWDDEDDDDILMNHCLIYNIIIILYIYIEDNIYNSS